MDNDFLLQDRLQHIKMVYEKEDLENNAYIAFSGGKDSTIVHTLFDMAVPNNKIPRIFSNTGLELKSVLDCVKKKAEADSRIIIHNVGVHIPSMLKSFGYPMKSKEFSHILSIYQNSGNTTSVNKYLRREESYRNVFCPSKLYHCFTPDFKLNVNDKCCLYLKKRPNERLAKEMGRGVYISGVRLLEKGQRQRYKDCLQYNKNGKLKHYKPLNAISDEWEEWFVEKYNVELPSVYDEPCNFKRTGCRGCPYDLHLQQTLEDMFLHLPNEFQTACKIFGKVYYEYIMADYRIRADSAIASEVLKTM